MLSPDLHARRRAALSERLHGAPVLLMGNAQAPRNYPANPLPFRQDSTFLYFTGCARPKAAALITAGGHSTLFLVPPADDDALWHGQSWTLHDVAAALGFDAVAPLAELEAHCAAAGTALRTLAVADPAATARAARISGRELSFRDPDRIGDQALAQAVIELRRVLAPEELAEMRAAAAVTAAAHHAAMGATRPGVPEAHVAALFDGVLAAAGMVPAYGSIVTVRGEVLHNDRHDGTCRDGDLLLLDGGAEAPAGYATDVTRTWPVSGRFLPRQRAAYDAVLAAQRAAIDRVRPGTRYRDVHDTASRVLAQWLVDEGLLRGEVDSLVERGAHALFFPHGVGHLLGLDVHDLEAFGDRAAYAPGRSRSPLFGTGYLRLDLDLQPGMCVTIEPGFYVVPAILSDRALLERLGDAVDLDAARAWTGFGGIRIEDDVLCTADGPEVITAAIDKDPDAVCARVGTGSDPFAALLDGAIAAR
ncbi:MAG: aminopeptidase P N-terminal domain-containing protein [Alphaproteobacteria bacterium]|nr:aminopeptidase P N-terminal domain-containing protein [Alphaproteobacteria bacterium]